MRLERVHSPLRTKHAKQPSEGQVLSPPGEGRPVGPSDPRERLEQRERDENVFAFVGQQLESQSKFLEEMVGRKLLMMRDDVLGQFRQEMNQTNLVLSNELADDVQKMERSLVDYDTRLQTLHDKVKNGMISLEKRLKLVLDQRAEEEGERDRSRKRR